MAFALAKAGKSIPARIAMMAITTSSSIKVKPEFFGDFFMAKNTKSGEWGDAAEGFRTTDGTYLEVVVPDH